MDQYGIGAAMSVALETYTQSARRSGRTSRLIQAVDDNTVIVTATAKEAARLNFLLHERKAKTGQGFVPAMSWQSFVKRDTLNRPVVLDHLAVELLHKRAIDDTKSYLTNLESLYPPQSRRPGTLYILHNP